MSDGPTYCSECRHVYKPTKDAPPWRWLCIKNKRLDGFGYVTPLTWDNADPYVRCADMNHGACPLFERIDT